MSTAGMPGWGNALGIVHSHPADGFSEDFPTMRLHPTPGAAGPNGQGDWYAFNIIQGMIAQDLMSRLGYSHEAAWTQANQFVQFVYGATEESATGSYSLFRYTDEDESNQNKSSASQVSDTDPVGEGLGLCGE